MEGLEFGAGRPGLCGQSPWCDTFINHTAHPGAPAVVHGLRDPLCLGNKSPGWASWVLGGGRALTVLTGCWGDTEVQSGWSGCQALSPGGPPPPPPPRAA
jgi:hypothetical protein